MEGLYQNILNHWGESNKELGFQIVEVDKFKVRTIEHQANQVFNIASAFKSIPLAAFLQLVELGKLKLSDMVLLTPELRVPDSEYTDSFKDNTLISFNSLLESMISVSDNTATEVILSKVYDLLLDILRNLKLSQTSLPNSLRKGYELFNTVTTEEDLYSIFVGENGILSCPADLVKFYRGINESKIFRDTETLDIFKRYMELEDNSQKTSWPNGMVCYRKSGNIDLSPYFAFSMAGWIEQNNRSTIYFSIMTNLRGTEEKANENLKYLKGSLKEVFDYARTKY